jgi:hypothetical protein
MSFNVVASNLVGATYQAQPGNPTAPNSVSVFKMQGLAGSITPVKSGTILILIAGVVINASGTAGDGISTQISYGTGAAPTGNGALAGTQAGTQMFYTNASTVTAASVLIPFAQHVVVTGLTLNTAYWIDLAAESVGNVSTGGLIRVSISAIEL